VRSRSTRLLDRHPVMVAEFRRFVTETGYVTLAQRPPDQGLYPDADPQLLVPGSLVFHRTAGPVGLDDVRAWWSYVPGACWTTPEGPGSTLKGRHRHPVTQVAYEDALAYARWAGKDLPTEAEWEYAARGGLDRKRFAWGDDLTLSGRMVANWWQGEFP
jgi:sulfatase modifying factor 1